MAWLEAALLGILQGLTEFLPVSSSGHLVLARALLPRLETPGILFEVLVHAGTLTAVLLFFRREISQMLSSLLPGGRAESRRLAFYIVAASIPTAIIGLTFKNYIEGLFNAPEATAFCLLITGALLWLSETFSRPAVDAYNMGYARAFGVGLWQSVALAPGISRSGATISGGRLLGITGEDAARFSFLISIPAVLGATLLEARHLGNVDSTALKLCLVGAAFSFVTGLMSLQLLLMMVRKSRLRWFAAYCWLAGFTALALL